MIGQIVDYIRRFFHWWGNELLACLPGFLRRLFRRKKSTLIVEFYDRQAILRRLRAGDSAEAGSEGATETLGRIPLDDSLSVEEARQLLGECLRGSRINSQNIIFRLPRAQVLRRTLDLPAAALENLREVLSFEMDRHTPFKAEEVFFDHRILGGRDDRLSVELVMVPKNSAETVIRAGSALGMAPSRVGVVGEAPAAFRLYPNLSSNKRPRLASALTALLAIAMVGLLSAAFYLPLEQKKERLDVLREELKVAQNKAKKAEAVRQEVDQRLASGAFLVERKQSRAPVSSVLAEITELLPDHTWVLQFGWRDDRLVLSGYSGKATDLIGLLERSDLLDKVRFNSPVTADPRVGLDRFNLTATVQDNQGS